MARRGRPRKQGKRFPSGKLSEKPRDVRDVVCAQPHRRGLAEDLRRDQRAETEIGRLFLSGLISEAKYWAAERWRGVVREFHVVLATPMQRSSALASMVAPGMEETQEADHLAAERPETEIEKRKRVLKAHGAAMRAIRSVAESGSVFAVLEAVVIEDRPCGEMEMDLLKRGLSALCWHWRMEDRAPGEEPDVRVSGMRAERPSWGHEEKELKIVYSNP